MEVLERIANNELLTEDVKKNLSKILEISVEDIKNDKKGTILSVLERLHVVSFESDQSETVSEGSSNVPEKDSKTETITANLSENSSIQPEVNEKTETVPENHSENHENISDMNSKTETVPENHEGKTEENKNRLRVKDSSKARLFEIYLEAKEIAVRNRKRLISGIVELSDFFDLSVKNTEMIYFLLILYHFSLKLNDTFPMIPGLFKKMMQMSFLGKFQEKAIDCIFDERTDWIEPEKASNASFEYQISYCSLNGIEYKGIVLVPSTTIYVDEVNSRKISRFDEKMLFSKFLKHKNKMIVF